MFFQESILERLPEVTSYISEATKLTKASYTKIFTDKILGEYILQVRKNVKWGDKSTRKSPEYSEIQGYTISCETKPKVKKAQFKLKTSN